MNLEEIKKKLETDPIEKLLELKKRRDRFVGKIVGVDAIAGIFVEVAQEFSLKDLRAVIWPIQL